jgi:hypothetical protein
MREYVIDFNKLETYECGAILVTLLAFPRDEEGEKARDRFHQSLCAEALRERFKAGGEWARTPQLIKPIYAFRDHKQVARDLRTLGRRIRDRMVAACMAMPFLLEAMNGVPPKLPEGVKRISLNEMSALVLEEAGQSVPENVETRIWRPSLPVIHLAAATAVIIGIGTLAGEGPFSVGDILVDRSIIRAIVIWAQVYEGVIAKSSRLSIDPETLIRVRLA